MDTPRRILGRTRRLTTANCRVFDEIFESGGGWVLDFGIATMTEWFEEVVGIDIFVPEYQRDGASKGKTLRGFVEVADGALVAFALQELWQYRATVTSDEPRSETRDAELKQWLDQFCHELSQLSDADVSAALVDFSADESLPLLRANIHRDLLDGNPHVAIDRIHTFATKRLRHALGERGSRFDNRTPLHSLFGAYMKDVKDSGQLKDFMVEAMRGQHRVLEALNTARNKHSLAHDTVLLDRSEARYLTGSVIATLAFVEAIEEDAS